MTHWAALQFQIWHIRNGVLDSFLDALVSWPAPRRRRPRLAPAHRDIDHPTKLAKMARAFCIPGVFFIFAAFVLLFIVSISLPYLSDMDITRVHTTNSAASALSGNDTTTELRVSFVILPLFAVLIPCLYHVVWYMVCASRPGAFYGALISPPGPIATTSQTGTESAAALVQS